MSRRACVLRAGEQASLNGYVFESFQQCAADLLVQTETSSNNAPDLNFSESPAVYGNTCVPMSHMILIYDISVCIKLCFYGFVSSIYHLY